MAKITLNPVSGSYASVTAFNARMQQIEDAFNNDVLWRDGFISEPNQMDNDLDMSGKDILNLPAPATSTSPVRLQELDSLVPVSNITESITVATKAIAVLLTPTEGVTLYILSEDGKGNTWQPVLGAAPGTYSDDGGSFCGTVFIPTGGDGSSAWVRDFNGYANVAWWGATDTVDATTSLRAAVATKLPLQFGHLTYEVNDDIGQSTAFGTTDVSWVGYGAEIKLITGTHRQYLCRIKTEGGKVRIEDIRFNGNLNTNRCLEIDNNAASMADALLSEIHLSKVNTNQAYRKTGALIGGEGIKIRGAFRNILLDKRTGATDCRLAPGAGIPGTVGISGITINEYSSTHTYSLNTVLDGIYVEKIWSEDLTYVQDQDGLKIFTDFASQLTPLPVSILVTGGSYFKNCFGRSVKFQANNVTVENTSFYRDDGLSVASVTPEVAFQTYGGTIKDCNFYYSNNQVPNVLVDIGTGENATVDRDYSTSYVENLKVYLDGITKASKIIETFPREGRAGPLSIKRIDVYGECEELVEYLVNGDWDTNLLTVRECYVEEITNDTATGNKALVRVRTSGDETSPATAKVNVFDCVYGGAATTYVLEDSVAGTSMQAVCSFRGNVGFVDNADDEFESNGLKSNQAERVSRIADITGKGFMDISHQSIAAGATGVFPVRITWGTLINVMIGGGTEAMSIFTASNSDTTSVHTGVVTALGTTLNPGTGTYNIWVSGTNEISVQNTDVSKRDVVLMALVPR